MKKTLQVALVVVLVVVCAPFALLSGAVLLGMAVGFVQNHHPTKTVEILRYREVPASSANPAPTPQP